MLSNPSMQQHTTFLPRTLWMPDNCLWLASFHDVRYRSTPNSLAHYKFVTHNPFPLLPWVLLELMYTYTDAECSIRHGSGPHQFIKIINFGAKNGPVGWNGLNELNWKTWAWRGLYHLVASRSAAVAGSVRWRDSAGPAVVSMQNPWLSGVGRSSHQCVVCIFC